MTLQVKVREVIMVVDSLPQAEELILQEIRNWYKNESDQEPLTIILEKNTNRGPPTIGVHVRDTIRHAERLAK